MNKETLVEELKQCRKILTLDDKQYSGIKAIELLEKQLIKGVTIKELDIK